MLIKRIILDSRGNISFFYYKQKMMNTFYYYTIVMNIIIVHFSCVMICTSFNTIKIKLQFYRVMYLSPRNDVTRLGLISLNVSSPFRSQPISQNSCHRWARMVPILQTANYVFRLKTQYEVIYVY